MNGQLRILIDENIGRPIANALGALLHFHESHPIVKHLLDLEDKQGITDDVWLPTLVDEKWVVITADQGRRGGPKLPRVCRDLGITHVLIRGKLHHARQFEKARAIVLVWPELVSISDAPPGTQFRLQLVHSTPKLIKTG